MNSEDQLRIINRWCSNFTLGDTPSGKMYGQVMYHDKGFIKYSTDSHYFYNDVINDTYLMVQNQVWYVARDCG